MTRRPRLPSRIVLARRGLAGGLSALLLVPLSACGGASDSSDASDASDPIGAASSAEPSADATTDEPAASSAPANDEVAAGESVDPAEFVDLFKAALTKSTTAHVRIETNSAVGGLTGEGDTDLSTTPPSMQMTMKLPQVGGDVEMRLVDGVAYMLLPQLGGKYISFDLSDPNNPLGASFADQFDIASQFDAFGEAIQKVTYVGNEDVDGEQLDHYALTVDGQAVADQADQAGVGGVGGVGGEAAGLPKVITYDMFFDGDGLFRRMTFDLGTQAGTTTMTYSDWGKDVSITAPKPSQITAMPGMPGSG